MLIVFDVGHALMEDGGQVFPVFIDVGHVAQPIHLVQHFETENSLCVPINFLFLCFYQLRLFFGSGVGSSICGYSVEIFDSIGGAAGLVVSSKLRLED